MDEDNAVGITLLKVGRRDEESDVQADADRRKCSDRKPRDHPPGQRKERLRRRILEPVNSHIAYENVSFQCNPQCDRRGPGRKREREHETGSE